MPGFFDLSYYVRTMPPMGPAGARSRTSGYNSRRTAVNPLLPMIFTAVVGGTASDGTYKITVTDDLTGLAYSTSFLRAGGEANAAISAGLAANWNAVSRNNDIFTAAAPNATGTYTGLVAGRTYTVGVTVPGTGTITIATTQAGGGIKLPPGVFVARLAAGSADGLTADTVRLLKVGDTISKVWALLERMQIMDEVPYNGVADETYKPGDRVPPMTRGGFWVECETAFNPDTDTPYIRIVATGSEQAGALRNDADGGDAIDASSILKVIQGTAAAGRVEIHIAIDP